MRWRLRLPAIVLLLLFGFAAGWQFDALEKLIAPERIIEPGLLFPVVSLAVAVILFEGGLSLRLRELHETGRTVLMLVTVGLQGQDADQKIISATLLENILAGERQRGKKVVFTNGCFDLLHVGHVKYLQAARQLGDLLVLGLNSDDSIRSLKGPNRPLIGQEERAHILAALDCIDYVVVFDEDTPLDVITVLRPDILVKGGDYTPEGVVGRELVESYGGRVELINFVDGKSTTNIINKILESYQS